MSRPKPKVLEVHLGRDWVNWEILEGHAIYYLTYKGRPCGVRRKAHLIDNAQRYLRTAGINRPHIESLAEALNGLFQTTDFAVVVVGGEA